MLDKYTQDLSNLPLEIKHLFQELRNKDNLLQEARKRYQIKDNQLHKFIRANGTLSRHPKEQQLYNKIEEDMAEVKRLQKEKILLANTAFFLISKHLYNFETDIAKLEKDDLLPTIESVFDFDEQEGAFGDNSVSNTPTPRLSTGSTPGVEDKLKRQAQKRKALKNSTSGGGYNSRVIKRSKSEESELRKYEDLNSRIFNSVESTILTGGNGLKLTGNDSMEDFQMARSPSFSVPHSNSPNNGEDADNNLYCFCQRVSFGEMIGCDNDDCQYEWFHWGCVGITAPPKDDEIWYCPDCAPRMEKRKKKRKT